jgi:glycosyltransferase involved in cell wall biosynthesis
MLWDFARDLNLPTAFHIHVLQQRLNELRGVEDTLSKRAQAQAIKEANVVLCPSHSVATEIAGIRPDASVVGQGIRVTVPSPVRDPYVSTVSYIGRFADIKGTSEFIRALAIVADERPSLRVVMAGGLPDNPKSEKRWRARILEALPNAELPGWLAPSDLERVYQESHIVVVPSWHETFGLVALEAMAHGAAVVASACGGLSELIAHNESGLLVPPQDCKALTRAVLELLNKPSWAEQLGQNAAMSVAARYKWPERIRALDRIYDGLIIFRKKVGRDRGKLKGA